MGYDPEKHHRRSIRLKGHDYAGGGCYFVTICAHRDAGDIFDAEMARQIIAERIQITQEKFPDVMWKEWIIMPDHFHALIEIRGGGLRLGDIVGGFKSAVSRELHRRGNACIAQSIAERQVDHKAARQASPVRIWQRNFYEVIVRSKEAEESIAKYIRLNPWKCINDFGDGFRGLGNPALWQCEKLGVLCSRNAPKIGFVPDAVVYLGGWHSPKEKEIFDWLLKHERKVIICPSWRIDSILKEKNRDKFSLLIEALEENRMLVIEMPDKEGSLVAAEARNRFVIKNADRLFTPHVTKGGMLERILKGSKI